jgi:predicted nucleic acid-binding protein
MTGETVCNATPLIALARIGRLELLRLAFRQLIIPETVYDEVVVKGGSKPGVAEVQHADWIQVRRVQNRQRVEELGRFLGRGETEAIILAREVAAARVLLDDRRARLVAQQEGLNVVGTLGVLKYLKAHGDLDVLRPLFDALRGAGFSMGAEYDEILQQVGEREGASS